MAVMIDSREERLYGIKLRLGPMRPMPIWSRDG